MISGVLVVGAFAAAAGAAGFVAVRLVGLSRPARRSGPAPAPAEESADA